MRMFMFVVICASRARDRKCFLSLPFHELFEIVDKIEEWTLNTTTITCANASRGEHDQTLYDKNVVPYLAMTLKGFVSDLHMQRNSI